MYIYPTFYDSMQYRPHNFTGIPRFMDVEDITDNVKPDDKSIMSYVAQASSA